MHSRRSPYRPRGLHRLAIVTLFGGAVLLGMALAWLVLDEPACTPPLARLTAALR